MAKRFSVASRNVRYLTGQRSTPDWPSIVAGVDLFALARSLDLRS